MRKVNKDEFVRLPAGTLYSVPDCSDNYGPVLMIKTDSGRSWGDGTWGFVGALPLGPDLPCDEKTGSIEKWLNDYSLNEYIKPEWAVNDTSNADFNTDEEIIIYDDFEIKTMIKFLQEWCLKKNFDNKTLNKLTD